MAAVASLRYRSTKTACQLPSVALATTRTHGARPSKCILWRAMLRMAAIAVFATVQPKRHARSHRQHLHQRGHAERVPPITSPGGPCSAWPRTQSSLPFNQNGKPTPIGSTCTDADTRSASLQNAFPGGPCSCMAANASLRYRSTKTVRQLPSAALATTRTRGARPSKCIPWRAMLPHGRER